MLNNGSEQAKVPTCAAELRVCNPVISITSGKAPELDLELDSEIADGIYSNLAIISHSASEFVVDFATILPGLAKPKIRSRIVLTPEHAKRLMLSLQDNIARYEASNGLIGLTPTAAEESTMPLGFCNKGEA